MQRVALMSEGIVESYRQNKKLKLQRTFVKASDAAESRYTGNMYLVFTKYQIF